MGPWGHAYAKGGGRCFTGRYTVEHMAKDSNVATAESADRLLVGVDFTSAPSDRKPIRLAYGRRRGTVVLLERQEALTSLDAFDGWLDQPGSWLGGFDLPFGLPRALVEALHWPTDWATLIAHYATLSRAEIRDTFARFCEARPVGSKFAYRGCDRPAGSSPSMKWVNPPVAYMLHAGVPRLLRAGVDFPGLHPGDPCRVALEAYPGLLAREVIAHRSYKSDSRAKHTPERLIARKEIVEALEQGRTRLGLRLKLSHAQREALVDDGSGDRLDAVLCLMQVAWAESQRNFGQPAGMDRLEGWIVSAHDNSPSGTQLASNRP